MAGNKRWIAVLLCLAVLLLAAPLPVFAEGESGYQVVIQDDADLLTEEQEAALYLTMVRVLPYGNAAFVSTNHNPTTAERYAEEKFLEFFGDTSGTLLLIDMENRYIQLIADGDVYKTVNRRRCNEITDNCYTYASQGDYAACATKAFSQVVRLLEGGRIAAPFRYVTNALLALCLAVMGNFALVSIQRKKAVTPENALGVKVAVNTAGKAAAKAGLIGAVAYTMIHQRRSKHVESSSSGGGRSGGGFSGGGGHSGGGGGFSGGGDGHRF